MSRSKDVLEGNLLRLSHATAYGVFRTALFIDEIADLARVHEKTAWRYVRDPSAIPAPMLELLEIKAMGLIPDAAFDGWSVKDGILISPLDKHLNPAQIENLSVLHQRASWLTRRIEQLESENENLREQQESDVQQLKRENDDLRGYIDIWRIRAGELPAANDDENREL